MNEFTVLFFALLAVVVLSAVGLMAWVTETVCKRATPRLERKYIYLINTDDEAQVLKSRDECLEALLGYVDDIHSGTLTAARVDLDTMALEDLIYVTDGELQYTTKGKEVYGVEH